MYQEAILDHYRNPRNVGEIPDPDIAAKEDNPLCGDQIVLYLKLDGNGVVEDVKFKGEGCAISQASASMLTLALKGKALDEVRQIDEERVLKNLGIPISPVRLKCALLSYTTLKRGLETYDRGGT